MAKRELACWALAGAVAATAASGRTFFVDQKHPCAADTNAATEALPFKTIQRAADVVESGDTVLVKAGVYREAVVIPSKYDVWSDPRRRARMRYGRIVFSAYGDDEVIIDGADPVPSNLWRAVAGRPGVFTASVRVPLEQGFLPAAYWQGERLPICFRTVAAGKIEPGIPGPGDAHTSFFDAGATNLYVNLGGADPRREGVVEAVMRSRGFCAWCSPGSVTLRKFTVRRIGWCSIFVNGGADPIVEDCEMYDSTRGISVGGSLRPIVRRCMARNICQRAMDLGSKEGQFYDNVVYAFDQNWDRQNDCYFYLAFICFGGEFARVYHNVVVQPLGHVNPNNRGGGFWPDVFGPGNAWVGNAVSHCGTPFYIESPMYANVVKWNTVTKSSRGIVLAVNAANVVAENYLDEVVAALTIQGTELAFPDLAHNLFSRNWVQRARSAVWFQAERGCEAGKDRQTRNYVQAGIYGSQQARQIGAIRYATLKEFQERAGQDTLGREEPIDPARVGLVWVRVDGLDNSHEVIPMIGNPGCDRQGWLFDGGPFFWRRGDGTGPDGYPEEWCKAEVDGREGRRPMVQAGTFTVWPEQGPVPGTPVEGPYLQVGALPGQYIGQEGVGWWSPSLPCVGGSTVDIAFWMKIARVKPTPQAGEEGGALACVEWTDWKGQNKSRSFLVGGRKPARPEPATGTRGWTEVKGSVTAPTTARRMALFLGARSCGGSVGYDEIRVLAARPGTGAVQVASSVGPAPDRPLVDPQTLRFVEVPLSGAFNRPLRDDMPDDGQGWLDLGPGYDLSGFPLGKKDYHGVPFSVADKCLMLKSPYRILSILPDRTNVPVNVRADVLYFLHTAAWVKPGERQWTYAVKYDDGTEREIPVIGGVNVREWGQAHSVVFDNPAGMRTVPAPEVTGNTLSPSCGMYIMEWVNPRPEAVIREIELVAAGRGVPVLFAITAGTKK